MKQQISKELRGITLQQLRRVCREIDTRCAKEKWVRIHNNKETNLQPDKVSFYDLQNNFLSTKTADSKCSYVEFIASRPQPPDWFVSHWWGQPVFEFLACIEQHAYDRNLNDDTTYWVYAFAQNCHEECDDLVNCDFKDCFLYRTLKVTKGLILIADRSATVFSRLWCTFEIFLALHCVLNEDNETPSDTSKAIVGSNKDGNHFLYDIYTHSASGLVVGLTDGVVAVDKYPRRSDGSLNIESKAYAGNYDRMQTIRQTLFPNKLCEKGLSICVETAETSLESDKRQILNFLTEKENLDGDPPKSHESYEYANALLKSKFAIEAYPRCLEEGRNVTLIRNSLADAPIDKLRLSFHGTRQFKKEAGRFTMALPTSLRFLDLNFAMQLFENSSEFAKGFRRLKSLKVFKLDCSTCTLTSCTDLWREILCLKSLQVLDLNFSYNQYLKTIKGIGQIISNLPHLRKIKLNFSQCTNINSIDDIVDSLSFLNNKKSKSSLVHLDLNFDSTGLSEENVMDLCHEIVISNIQKIHLNFNPIIDLKPVKNTKQLKAAIDKYPCWCCTSVFRVFS